MVTIFQTRAELTIWLETDDMRLPRKILFEILFDREKRKNVIGRRTGYPRRKVDGKFITNLKKTKKRGSFDTLES